MQTLQLDKNNNLMFDYNLKTIQGTEAIKQDIKTLLLMFKSEYPFNLEMGINWYDLTIYNYKNDIIQAIKERIKEDKRISNINKIDVNFSQRKLNIILELDTIFGVVNV